MLSDLLIQTHLVTNSLAALRYDWLKVPLVGSAPIHIIPYLDSKNMPHHHSLFMSSQTVRFGGSEVDAPDCIEAIFNKQVHVLINKAPVRIKRSLHPRHPGRTLHHYINPVEISLPLVAIHQSMCCGVHKQEVCSRHKRLRNEER